MSATGYEETELNYAASEHMEDEVGEEEEEEEEEMDGDEDGTSNGRLSSSVADPDPLGSQTFCRIRIRDDLVSWIRIRNY